MDLVLVFEDTVTRKETGSNVDLLLWHEWFALYPKLQYIEYRSAAHNLIESYHRFEYYEDLAKQVE
jgi:hypothetical protein